MSQPIFDPLASTSRLDIWSRYHNIESRCSSVMISKVWQCSWSGRHCRYSDFTSSGTPCLKPTSSSTNRVLDTLLISAVRISTPGMQERMQQRQPLCSSSLGKFDFNFEDCGKWHISSCYACKVVPCGSHSAEGGVQSSAALECWWTRQLCTP